VNAGSASACTGRASASQSSRPQPTMSRPRPHHRTHITRTDPRASRRLSRQRKETWSSPQDGETMPPQVLSAMSRQH
jgi:hypothetical protein